MALAEHFFSYRLFKERRTVRLGKGGVSARTKAALTSYLAKRYPGLGWDRAAVHWHASESAAFKAEERKIETYERLTGALPPWNMMRGGSGGSSFVGCKALMTDGRPCRNSAIAGYYGYCGVHY